RPGKRAFSQRAPAGRDRAPASPGRAPAAAARADATQPAAVAGADATQPAAVAGAAAAHPAAVAGATATQPAARAPARSTPGKLRGGASDGFLSGIPPSPELLAKVDALPPASETPGVAPAVARAPDPHFTLRRLLRPFLAAFAVGLVLDGLDALANLAMPALVRGGIDHGIETGALTVIGAVSVAALLITGAD